MIRNLPVPMEDETLQSIFARYYESTIYISAKKMLKDLLQRKAFGSLANVPLGISMVQEAFSLSDIELSNLIHKHSFLPYFTAFSTGEWKEKINHVVYSEFTDGEVSCRISGLIYGNKMAEYLRFCPICAANDYECMGFTYWRRKHQLPGVCVCETHGSILLETQLSATKYSNRHFNLASIHTLFPARPVIQLQEESKFLANAIARGQAYVIENSEHLNELFHCNIDAARIAIHSLLREKKMLSPQGYICRNELILDFSRFYGEDILKFLHIALGKQLYLWIYEIIHNPAANHNALKIVLLGVFLAGSFENFVSEVERFR